MQTGYQPKGRAREYSELALNLYTGCSNGCSYCFNRKFPWYQESIFNNPTPRNNILSELEKYASKRIGDPREILLCFTCDPYPSLPCEDITRDALLILEKYKMKVQVLTKGGTRACRDFDILLRNSWKFGSTITGYTKEYIGKYESNAAEYQDRKATIVTAFNAGIYTWVSLEPVIDHSEAIFILSDLLPYVNYWKIGKINHNPVLENSIEWDVFLDKVRQILGKREYLIKKDLLEASERAKAHRLTNAWRESGKPNSPNCASATSPC